MSKDDNFIKHGKIDSYLWNAFESWRTDEELPWDEGEGKVILPMLLRVDRELWRSESLLEPGTTEESVWSDLQEGHVQQHGVPDLEITSQLGSVVACNGSRETMLALERDPSVLSIEASRCATPFESQMLFVGAGSTGSGTIPLLDFIKASPVLVSERGGECLVAIIDSGIDVFHPAFQTGGQTRIIEIWDQEEPGFEGPRLDGMKKSYGKLYTQSDIQFVLDHAPTPISAPSGLPEGLVSTRPHGMQVASVAAGTPAGFSGGVAPESQILVVRVPDSNSWNDPQALLFSKNIVDALVYIRRVAEKRKMPVIVNLSQGVNGGAHDGSWAIEVAFDEFTNGGTKPGFAIVKSAGNERARGKHACLAMLSDTAETLRWEATAHKGPDNIELWFKACDELFFQLVVDKARSNKVTSKNPHDQLNYGSIRATLRYDRYFVDNGDSRLLVTIDHVPGGKIAGKWSLEIESGEIRSDGVVHAWIDQTPGVVVQFLDHREEDNTITVPGTAHSVLCVGSVRHPEPYLIPGYSGFGPTRDGRIKPELVAPGIKILAAAPGGKVLESEGTSLAAAQVTGALALVFSYRKRNKMPLPSASQVRAAISHTTQNYSGRANSRMGYGVLDVEELFKQFM